MSSFSFKNIGPHKKKKKKKNSFKYKNKDPKKKKKKKKKGFNEILMSQLWKPNKIITYE